MASGNPAINRHALRPGFGFATLFIVAATLAAALTAQQHAAFSLFARTVTVPGAFALGNLLGLSMNSNGNILTVNGFDMQVIDECTALNYIIILVLAILLYTRHTYRYRLTGIVIATPCLLFANSVRLIVTGMAGAVSPGLFHFVHEYLWVALFALLVVGIWKVWADGGLSFNRQSAGQAGIVLISCTGVFLVLIAFKDQHCRLLASMASPLFKLLLGDSQALVRWDGSLFQYTQGKTTTGMTLFFEMANIAVYAGLMLPYLWRNRHAVRIALLGLVLLVVMYAEFIALVGMNGIRNGKAAADLIRVIGSGVFLALPMALYWIITALQRQTDRE